MFKKKWKRYTNFLKKKWKQTEVKHCSNQTFLNCRVQNLIISKLVSSHSLSSLGVAETTSGWQWWKHITLSRLTAAFSPESLLPRQPEEATLLCHSFYHSATHWQYITSRWNSSCLFQISSYISTMESGINREISNLSCNLSFHLH